VSEDLLETNPAHGIRKRGQEVQRERIMSETELRAFWRSLTVSPADRAIKLLLLLGQRRSEVAQASAAELQPAAWHIPATRAKNSLPNVIPLTPFARKLFGSGFSIHPSILSHRFHDIARDFKMRDIRLHDLRHCCATGMAAL
jgi:integrase